VTYNQYGRKDAIVREFVRQKCISLNSKLKHGDLREWFDYLENVPTWNRTIIDYRRSKWVQQLAGIDVSKTDESRKR
jgi:hypothetical protein